MPERIPNECTDGRPRAEETAMKLIIQIPCFNEEKTLPATLRNLPKNIPGIDRVEILVIDDGSEDRTADVARRKNVDHIVSFKRNQGLARAFSAGIDRCLELGADIIVNTDADNQYRGADIPRLVAPILAGEADLVIGDRQVENVPHFSRPKKILNRLGSAFIRLLSGTEVRDAVSGFRAYSREAAMRINTFTDFSHTIEHVIQLGQQKLKIVSLPIRTNGRLRRSRLFKSVPGFLSQQSATLVRTYATYRALKVFSWLGLVLILPGLYGFLRFFYYFFTGTSGGHVQSLIFSTVSIIIGFFVAMFGIIADMISNNRKLIEKTLYYIRKMESARFESDPSGKDVPSRHV
jgi:glycosyltransferase involved in cell wall biosynthesis